MKNTTAFLGGCAVTGVLALFLLKSCFNLGLGPFGAMRSNLGLPAEGGDPSSPLPVPTPQMGHNNFDLLNEELAEQQESTEALESNLQEQRLTIEQLRSNLDRQEMQGERLTMRLEEQQRAIDDLRLERTRPRFERYEQATMFQTNLLWAIAGVVLALVIGSGIIIVGVIALLVQPNRRSNDRSQAFDASNLSPPYSFYEPYTDFLPPQSKMKRPK